MELLPVYGIVQLLAAATVWYERRSRHLAFPDSFLKEMKRGRQRKIFPEGVYLVEASAEGLQVRRVVTRNVMVAGHRCRGAPCFFQDHGRWIRQIDSHVPERLPRAASKKSMARGWSRDRSIQYGARLSGYLRR